MSTASVTPDPYAAYGGKVASGGGTDPYAAYGGKVSAGLAPKSEAPQKGFFESAADASGLSGIAGLVGSVAQHPIDTLLGVKPLLQGIAAQGKESLQNVQQGVADYRKEGLTEKTRRDFGRAVPIVGPALATAQGQHDAGNDAGMAGTLAGTVAGLAGPKALKEVAPLVPGAVGRAAVATGEAAQDAGTGLMNKTVGTLKADFKRGANPARGYLETGNGPSLSMHSVADKSAQALEDVGQKLGAAYQQATASGAKIPVDVVAQEMAKPLQKAIDLETGPGGTGNLAPIRSYIQQFAPAFDKAAQNGGFTPSELFDIKRSIAQNTNWSDPTQFNLKSVRQQQAGALSGILADAVPETKALNQTYQDLTKMTNRAEERANTGSRPLTSHIYKAGMTAAGALAGGMEGNALMGAAAGALMDSVPAKTTIATGLFRGGKALARFGDRLTPAEGATVEGVPPNDLGGNGTNNKPSNPQLTPPANSNPTTATQKWAAIGAQKVIAHLENSSSDLSPADVAEAANTPKGEQLLLQASSLTPGSPILEKIVQQIPKASAEKLEPSNRGDISWVAVDKATGKAAMETFSPKVAAAVNRDKYDVLPIGQYLGNLNKQIREASAPKVYRDFDQYAAENAASRHDYGEPALHRSSSNVSASARKSAIDRQAAKDSDLTDRRDALRTEYKDKLRAGTIREMTAGERMRDTATGDPDNESVQAARRILKKRQK